MFETFSTNLTQSGHFLRKSTKISFQDEDGVLSFSELGVVMKSLGQRPSGMKFFDLGEKSKKGKNSDLHPLSNISFLFFFFSHSYPSHGIMAQQSPRIISTESENHHRMQNLPTGHLPKNIQKSTDIIDTNVPQEKKLLTMVRSVSEDKLYDTIEFNEFLQVFNIRKNRFLLD